MLIGVGATPLYILTPPYMARSLDPERFSLFLGIFYVPSFPVPASLTGVPRHSVLSGQRQDLLCKV